MHATLTEHSTHLILPKGGELRFNYKPQIRRISIAEFEEICELNSDMRIEMDKDGDVIIMPPTYSETSEKNLEIVYQLKSWAKKDKRGKAYESSGGFRLENGAVRSPDAAWILKERLETLSENDRKGFIKICPDFVIELRSDTDSLPKVKAKMNEYIENGAKLGWLIDPIKKRVHIYRTNKSIEILENPKTLSGEEVLPNFELDLSDIL
jgi:Uma2 family endonuclease